MKLMEPLIRDLSIQYEKPDVGVTHRSLLGLLGGLVQVFHIFMEFNFHTANIGYSTFYGHGGYTGFRETLQTILVSFARYLVSIDGSDMNDSGDRMLVRRIMLLSTALYEQLEWHPYTPHFGVSERFTGRGRYSKHCDGIRDRLSSMWHAQEIPPNFESFCNAVDREAPALMYMWSKEGLRRGPGNLFCPIELFPRKIYCTLRTTATPWRTASATLYLFITRCFVPHAPQVLGLSSLAFAHSLRPLRPLRPFRPLRPPPPPPPLHSFVAGSAPSLSPRSQQ